MRDGETFKPFAKGREASQEEAQTKDFSTQSEGDGWIDTKGDLNKKSWGPPAKKHIRGECGSKGAIKFLRAGCNGARKIIRNSGPRPSKHKKTKKISGRGS